MAIRGLAEYFGIKYAGNKEVSLEDPILDIKYKDIVGDADKSLGLPISASVAQRLKDKLIVIYDDVKDEITNLPEFKDMYAKYGDLPVISALDNIIDAYIVNISESKTLKEALIFGIKYIGAFNKLRDSLPGMMKDKEAVHTIDHAIYTMQMHMWPKMKAMLDMHKIGKSVIPMNEEEAKEIKGILNMYPEGTWHYGPGANPTKPPFQKYTADTAGKVINRAKKEILKDEVAKELGDYKTELEIKDKVEDIEQSEKDRKAELASIKNRLKDRIKARMKGATSQDVKDALNEELVKIYSKLGKGASESDFKRALIEKINELRVK